MSMTASELTPADIWACTNNGNGYNNDGWGGGWSSWIILFLIFGLFGLGNYGGFGGGFGGGGTAAGYTLASDFATIQRQMSDGFGGVEKGLDTIRNGLCDGFYTEAQLVNGVNTNILQSTNAIQTQLADCCCKTQQNIKDVQYGIATASGDIKYAIKDCCCDTEKQFMQSRFDSAQNTCATLQAIDKVGDRVIDYLANEKAQALRDENQALRLAASQSMQNNYLIQQLRPAPVPAFAVPAPYCYGNFGGCGCNA